ncbi:MAG TPA: hypothetical protein VMV92_29460 [Streptosporangiaceae bacterium]|nr:hypothetical protein [Streptosporangiaceae bacterium]
MDGGGAGEQGVVLRMGVLRQLLPVLGGGDDGLKGAAEVGDGAGEDLVGPAGQAGHVRSVFGKGRAESPVDQARGRGGQTLVPEIAMRYMRAV